MSRPHLPSVSRTKLRAIAIWFVSASRCNVGVALECLPAASWELGAIRDLDRRWRRRFGLGAEAVVPPPPLGPYRVERELIRAIPRRTATLEPQR
jgi:hypothetical protein